MVKLVLEERESAALRAAVRGRTFASSDLARTELRRAVRRSEEDAMQRAEDLLRLVRLAALPGDLLDAAGRLAPSRLRSLDAIHVQSALLLGDELEALITYDDRMAEAARTVGIAVRSPT